MNKIFATKKFIHTPSEYLVVLLRGVPKSFQSFPLGVSPRRKVWGFTITALVVGVFFTASLFLPAITNAQYFEDFGSYGYGDTTDYANYGDITDFGSYGYDGGTTDYGTYGYGDITDFGSYGYDGGTTDYGSYGYGDSTDYGSYGYDTPYYYAAPA